MTKNTYELTELIADDGKILTDGTDYRLRVLGRTESIGEWTETDIEEKDD